MEFVIQVRVLNRSKIHASTIIVMLIVILFVNTIVAADEFDISVSINPLSQNVSSEETFSVKVYCAPDHPIKSFEFGLSFDASLLEAISVTEGDIFNGYTTFFNPGTIDNAAGTIDGVFNLIMDSGNVSDPGTFVTILFIAKINTGTSILNLLNVGVTNETGYISISVDDGAVIVEGINNNPDAPDIPSGGDGDGGGSLPSSGGDNSDTSEQNNPPEVTVKPSGSTFIEMGVEYTYSTSTFDVDGDQIRYRFDWGDGNYSNWSDFMFSNTSVSMSHYWSAISNYSVRVMAQDENGMNNSWSPALSVTVSQADSGEIPPVVDINVSSNVSVNQTVVFDAVDIFDQDGTIVSYMWDFGDGETGSGASLEHAYKKPGSYNVTLVLIDNNNNIYGKIITVNVASVVVEEQSEEKRDVLLFNFGIVIIWSMVAMICVFALFFIKRLFFSNLHTDMSYNIRGLEESGSKIEKTKISKIAYLKGAVSNKITDGIDFIRASVVKMGDYYDKIQENYIKSNYKDELSFKENMHSDDSHGFYVDEKIEIIPQERLGSVKLSVEDSVFPRVENINPIVDNPILSNIEKKLPVEKDDMFDESIESIRRKVDEIWASRERE